MTEAAVQYDRLPDVGAVLLFLAMRIVYLLIPLTLLLAGFAIGAFIWAVRNGQFDDLEGPAHRILMDDDDPRIPRGPGHTRDAEPPSQP